MVVLDTLYINEKQSSSKFLIFMFLLKPLYKYWPTSSWWWTKYVLLSLLQVNNTDAEGRLTLADALIYACNQGVDKVMQIHTIVIINSVL